MPEETPAEETPPPMFTEEDVRAIVAEALGRPVEDVVADESVPHFTEAEMHKLLSGVSAIADEGLAEIDSLGPAITEEELRATAAADPEEAEKLLDGHLAAAEEKARVAKQKVIDRIKLAIKIGALAAGAAGGGPAGAAAAGGLASALDGAGEG